MPGELPSVPHKQVTLIPTDRICILNPRVRNRQAFEEIIENIARIGPKRPIMQQPARLLSLKTAPSRRRPIDRR